MAEGLEPEEPGRRSGWKRIGSSEGKSQPEIEAEHPGPLPFPEVVLDDRAPIEKDKELSGVRPVEKQEEIDPTAYGLPPREKWLDPQEGIIDPTTGEIKIPGFRRWRRAGAPTTGPEIPEALSQEIRQAAKEFQKENVEEKKQDHLQFLNETMTRLRGIQFESKFLAVSSSSLESIFFTSIEDLDPEIAKAYEAAREELWSNGIYLFYIPRGIKLDQLPKDLRDWEIIGNIPPSTSEQTLTVAYTSEPGISSKDPAKPAKRARIVIYGRWQPTAESQ